MTRLASRLALGTVAAMALYAATLGLTMTDPCSGVAGAAPSPTCGGDLRECLRLSTKTGIYGARYVEADDVARCVEAFNACIHGGASSGGNANPPTSHSPGGSRKGLPQHFAFRDNYGIAGDCRVIGDSVACSLSWAAPPDWVDSWSGTVTGTLSGLTVTGTQKILISGHVREGCSIDERYTSSITYVFSLDGTVKLSSGPVQRQSTFGCGDPTSGTSEGGATEGTWSAVN